MAIDTFLFEDKPGLFDDDILPSKSLQKSTEIHESVNFFKKFGVLNQV
jgi:hypothetical protein